VLVLIMSPLVLLAYGNFVLNGVFGGVKGCVCGVVSSGWWGRCGRAVGGVKTGGGKCKRPLWCCVVVLLGILF